MGRRGFYSQVKDLISKYNLDILTCMDSRDNTKRALKIIKKISYAQFLENSFGRFFWRNLVVLERQS